MAALLMMAAAGCTKSAEQTTEQVQVEGVPAGSGASGEQGGTAPAGGEQPGGGQPGGGQPGGGQPGGTAPGGMQSSGMQPSAPAGGGSGMTQSAPKTVAPPPPVTVAEGTEIAVRTVETLSTKSAENGTRFEATLREPLIVGNYVVAPKGARAYGVVSNADDGGRVKGVASITVRLTELEVNGKRMDVTTSTVTHVAKATKKQDAVKVGVASGIGAAIGAIAGGGKGAAIGAGAGAGAGTGVVLATKGEAAVIASESPLTFKLTAPVTVARN
ncbi:MAG: hypothetical protein J0L64_26570 [Acidobacteria bacterium]|nr:hypothetical protein [Acidobacteriota bacterium]